MKNADGWMWLLRRALIRTAPQRPKNASYESAVAAPSTHSGE